MSRLRRSRDKEEAKRVGKRGNREEFFRPVTRVMVPVRVHYSEAGGALASASNSFSMKPGVDTPTMPYTSVNARIH